MIAAILAIGYVVSFAAGIAVAILLDERGDWEGRPAFIAGLAVFLLGPVIAPVAIGTALWFTGRWLAAGVGEVRELLRDDEPPAALPEARALERDP